MPQLTVNLINEAPDQYTVPEELIKKVLTTAYDHRADNDGEVNVLVTSDEEIARMNETYLNHEGPTDVLAFDDGDEDDNGFITLGDIAVSADTAAKMAKEKGMDFKEELTLYCLHGTLHLLGMRDHTDELRQEMIDAQTEEFARHGLKYIV